MYGTNTLHNATETARETRLNRQLARARRAQLALARAGRIRASARWAARARLVRAALSTAVSRLGPLAVLLLAPTLVVAQVTPVRTAEVREDVVQEHRRVTGSLQAISRADLAAQEAGLIQTVLVDEGSKVAAGDVIARLDPRRLSARLNEARAALENARAVVAEREAEVLFAEYERDRVTRLFEAHTASERERNEAVRLHGVSSAQALAARKAVDSASREVELLEIRLEDTEVRAPFPARVVARHVEPGEWINPGEPLVTLVSTGQIEARLEVPERYASTVFSEPGSLYVELAADGRSVKSLDVRPVPDVDARARTFQVFVTIDNSADDLAPGMAVNAWVPTSKEARALLAPKDAVIRDGRDAYVYRVSDAEQPAAERTPVTVLFAWGDTLAVESPVLQSGDRVVVEGNERLQPQAPLSVASRN